MDPFSLIVGLVGLSDATARTASKLFKLVSDWRDAPEDVCHLRDYVVSTSEFFSRLHYETKEHIGKGQYSKSAYTLQAFRKILTDLAAAQSIVLEIDQILGDIEPAGRSNPAKSTSKLRKDRWMRKRGRIFQLQSLLNRVQSLIFEGLVSINVTLTTDVLSEVYELKEGISSLKEGSEMSDQLLASRITKAIENSQNEISANFTGQIMTSQLGIVNNFDQDLQRQLHQHAISMTEKIESNGEKLYKRLESTLKSVSSSNILPDDRSAMFYGHKDSLLNTVGDSMPNSTGLCGCRSYSVSKTNVWYYEKCKATIGIIGFWYATQARRKSTCKCGNTYPYRWIMATYTFPRWLADLSLYMLYRRTNGGTPEILLRMVKRIPDDSSHLHSTIVGCIQRRDVHAAQIMLGSNQASVLDLYGRQNRSLLIQTCFIKDVEMAKLLIKNGADPLALETLNYCSLYPRVHVYWDFLCKEVGLDIPISAFFDDAGLTELHQIVVGIMPIALNQALLKRRYNCDVNTRDSRGCTPLHYAASMGNSSHVSLLIQHGANIEARTNWRSTPLYEACLTGKYEAAKVLLIYGAQVDSRVQHNATPLRMACDFGTPELVDLLLSYGADLQSMNFRGNCKLDAVVYNDNAEVLRLLLEKFQPEDIDQQDAEGETVVIKAIAWDAAKCLHLILERMPNLSIINKYGQNILHKLAASAKVEVISMFAEHLHSAIASLDATAKDRHGRTARDLFNERPGITEDLREAFDLLLWRTAPGPHKMPIKEAMTEKTCLLEKHHDGELDTDIEDNDVFFDTIALSEYL